MAVQKNRVTRSKRGQRRSHHGIRAAVVSSDEASGERHLRHHMTEDGFYRGRQVERIERPDDDADAD